MKFSPILHIIEIFSFQFNVRGSWRTSTEQNLTRPTKFNVEF